MPVATRRHRPALLLGCLSGLADNERRRFEKLAAQRKVVVLPHFPLDFPGTASIAVHVDGSSWVATLPGSARRACGGASIAKGDAAPEDEDDGQ